MKLENFISKYSLDQILELEKQDEQFIALQNSRKSISQEYWNTNFIQNIFLFLILQNSLVSYQISGEWKLWRQEFSLKIHQDFNILKDIFTEQKSNVDRRHKFMTNSKYNNRIYNIKTQRLQKFDKIKIKLNFYDNFGVHNYKNMLDLLNSVSQVMKQKKDSKTLVFAIKMFGYGARIVFEEIIPYHPKIDIPLDSRLKKIYYTNFPQKSDAKDPEIKKYFFELAQKHKIPPLHLDSVLRLDYRKLIKNK